MLKEEKIKSDQEKDYRILFHQKYKLAEASRYAKGDTSQMQLKISLDAFGMCPFLYKIYSSKKLWVLKKFHV